MIIDQNGISYEINHKFLTAKVMKTYITRQSIGDIFIPRYVNYNSTNYSVIGICEGAFMFNQRIKSIQFPQDSEIQFIGKEAFSNSSIKSITIPRKVKIIEEKTFENCLYLTNVEISEDSELYSIEKKAFSSTRIQYLFIPSKFERLDEKWCKNVFYLNDIKVSPNNKHFILYNDQLLLYKRDENQQNFDKIIFCLKKSIKVIIPSFIKTIGSYSCVNIYSIEFEKDSQLETIEEGA